MAKEKSEKIELPTITVEKKSDRPFTNPVLYDVEWLKGKHIRQWMENGKAVEHESAIFTTQNDYVRIAIGYHDLIKMLKNRGIIVVIE